MVVVRKQNLRGPDSHPFGNPRFSNVPLRGTAFLHGDTIVSPTPFAGANPGLTAKNKLRGPDSHRDLKVMSLANYCYSTPRLKTALVPTSGRDPDFASGLLASSL